MSLDFISEKINSVVISYVLFKIALNHETGVGMSLNRVERAELNRSNPLFYVTYILS